MVFNHQWNGVLILSIRMFFTAKREFEYLYNKAQMMTLLGLLDGAHIKK